MLALAYPEPEQGKRATSFNLKEVNTRDLSHARCVCKYAVDDGRVGKVSGDRKSERSLTKSSFLISDPQRRFAGLYRANEKYAQQAYALVTRDPFGAEAVARVGRSRKTCAPGFPR
jgi:hypothetical protein